jgi:hypothetical protein
VLVLVLVLVLVIVLVLVLVRWGSPPDSLHSRGTPATQQV